MKTFISNACSEWSVGNGSLLLTFGANGVLRVGGYGETFFAAEWDENGAYREAYREDGLLGVYFYGMPRPSDPLLRRSAVRIMYYMDGEAPILVVGTAASHDLTAAIRLGEGVRAEFFDRIASVFGGIPCAKLTAPSGRCLYAALEGDVRFDETEGRLYIGLGQGRLILLAPEGAFHVEGLVKVYERIVPPVFSLEPPSDRLYKRGAERHKQIFRRLSPRPLVGEDARPLLEEVREECYARQSREGGLFLGDGPISLVEQCATAVFLCADGNRLQAGAFLRYLDDLTVRYGRFPYACTADGITDAILSDPFGGAATAVLLFLDAYACRFGGGDEPRLSSLAAKAATELLPHLRCGMMPTGLWEGSPSPFPFCGSAEATLRFLKAGRTALSLGGDAMGRTARFRLAAALDSVRASFAECFSRDGRWFLYRSEWGKGIKQPSRLYGRCPFCESRSWLIRQGSAYVCAAHHDPLPFLRTEEIAVKEIELALLAAVLGLSLLPSPDEKALPEVKVASFEMTVGMALCPSFSFATRREAAEEIGRRCHREETPLVMQCLALTVMLSVAAEERYRNKKEVSSPC
ncbi:MAG: hypothetical protein IJD10_07595 [Clostridia bacterium]|nr:hypothetical protein [Clostridia bacterium]